MSLDSLSALNFVPKCSLTTDRAHPPPPPLPPGVRSGVRGGMRARIYHAAIPCEVFVVYNLFLGGEESWR